MDVNGVVPVLKGGVTHSMCLSREIVESTTKKERSIVLKLVALIVLL